MAALLLVLLLSACSGEDSPSATATPTASPTPESSPTPEATSTPESLFSGYDLPLTQGAFWEYRWEYVDQSCAQGSGCSTDDDDGTFRVTLGAPRTVQGVQLFALNVSGKTSVSISDARRDFAPGWDYLGVDGNRLVVSNGSSLTTLFDAVTGRWAGSGFFTDRFNNKLVEASSRRITEDMNFGAWDGVETGPVQSVGWASSQSTCEIIIILRVCPNDEEFNFIEREYYREGIGPVAYTYSFSISFSGGGFFSSSRVDESLALVASSLRDGGAASATSGGTGERESEPNDIPADAQLMQVGGAISGSVSSADSALTVTLALDGRRQQLRMHDYYRFELTSLTAVSIDLEISGPASDLNLGLLLWNEATNERVMHSLAPGVAAHRLKTELSPGAYRIGITGIDTQGGPVPYTLSIKGD